MIEILHAAVGGVVIPDSMPAPPRYRLSLCYVTPTDVDTEFLPYNTRNRPLDMRRIAKKVKAMTTGAWIPCGNPDIRFDVNGVMIDGQHTCYAVKQTGIPMWLFVARDLDVNAIKVIDVSVPRKLSEVAGIFGVSLTDTLIRAVSLEHFDFDASEHGTRSATNQEIIDIVVDGYNEEMVSAVKRVLGAARSSQALSRDSGAVLIRLLKNAKANNSFEQVTDFLAATLSNDVISPAYDATISPDLLQYYRNKKREKKHRIRKEGKMVVGTTADKCEAMLTKTNNALDKHLLSLFRVAAAE